MEVVNWCIEHPFLSVLALYVLSLFVGIVAVHITHFMQCSDGQREKTHRFTESQLKMRDTALLRAAIREYVVSSSRAVSERKKALVKEQLDFKERWSARAVTNE